MSATIYLSLQKENKITSEIVRKQAFECPVFYLKKLYDKFQLA